MKVMAKMPDLLRTQAMISRNMTIVRMSAVQISRPKFAMSPPFRRSQARAEEKIEEEKSGVSLRLAVPLYFSRARPL